MNTNFWQTGLCNCCAAPGGVQACCLGFFCTAELYGLNVERLERPHECALGGSCIGAGVVWYSLAALYGSCWVAQCATRGAVRRRYSIPGNAACDCLVSLCCCCCAVIQEYNQLHSEPHPPGARGIQVVGNNLGSAAHEMTHHMDS